jgi:hypothetical protein
MHTRLNLVSSACLQACTSRHAGAAAFRMWVMAGTWVTSSGACPDLHCSDLQVAGCSGNAGTRLCRQAVNFCTFSVSAPPVGLRDAPALGESRLSLVQIWRVVMTFTPDKCQALAVILLLTSLLDIILFSEHHCDARPSSNVPASCQPACRPQVQPSHIAQHQSCVPKTTFQAPVPVRGGPRSARAWSHTSSF